MPVLDPGNLVILLPTGTPVSWDRARHLLTPRLRGSYVPRSVFPLTRRPRPRLLRGRSPDPYLDLVRDDDGTHRVAGGPVGMLDLPALARRADLLARHRWQTWQALVARTTPRARDWPTMLAGLRPDAPARDLARARERFEAQPRVLAMLALTCSGGLPFPLDPEELELFQAGEAAYSILHWQQELVGQALIGPPGLLLRPDTDALADRLRYLHAAVALVRHLEPDRVLLAASSAPTG